MYCKNTISINFILFFCIIAIFINLKAQDVINLSNTSEKISLNPFMQILEDTSATLTISDVISDYNKDRFKFSKQEVPNFGFTKSAYWVRFKVKSNDFNNRFPYVLEIIYPNIHYVDLFQLNEHNQIIRIAKSGIMREISSRDIIHPHLAFYITLKPGSEHTFYLRFQNDASMTLDLNLWQMDRFLMHSQNTELILGFFCGILLLLTGFSIFNYFTQKDKVSIYFSISLFSLFFFTICYNGLANIYFWPNSRYLKLISTPVSMGLMGSFFLMFTNHFLQLDKISKLLNKIVVVLIYLFFITIFLGFFIQYSLFVKIILVLIFIGLLLITLCAIFSFYMGLKPAIYFLIGFSPFLILSIFLISVRINLLPSQLITEQGYLLSGLFLILILAFAQINRFKTLHVEKSEVQDILNVNQKRFFSLLKSSNSFVWEVNKNQEFSYVSSNVKSLLGYDPSEFYGKRVFDFMSNELSDKFLEPLKNILKAKKSIIKYEIAIISKGGNPVIFQIDGSPLFDDSEQLVGYRGIAKNITERIKHEISLKDSEEKYRNLFQTMEQGVVYYNLNGEIISTNPAAEKILGLNLHEIQGKKLEDLRWELKKEDGSNFSIKDHPALISLKSGKKVHNIVMGVINPKTKKQVWLNISAIPEFQTGSKKPFQVYTTFDDITEHISLRNSLIENEFKYKSLFESANDAIFIMDGEKFIDCNKKTLEMFGCTRKQIINKPPYEFSPDIQPDGRNSKEKALEKINNAIAGKSEVFEWKHSRHDKSTFDAEVNLNKLKLNEKIYIQAIVRDISQRKQSDLVQIIMSNISAAVSQTQNLQEFFKVVHRELNKIIDSTNFFVALYDEKSDTITLPYMEDEKDKIEKVPISQTISAHVIKYNQSLLLKEKDMIKLQQEGKIGDVGSPCKVWLGVPLRDENKVVGLVAVQSYTDEKAYSEADLTLMEFVSGQIAISLKKKQIEERLKILSLSVEQSPALIVITDLKGDIEYVNPKFIEVTGYLFEDVMGKNPRILKSGMTPGYVYEDLWKKLLNGEEWRGEFQNKRKNGQIYWEFAYISPIKNESGKITHYLAVKEDVTQQKMLQQQLIHSQKMEAVGTLAGGIAHDFNNILTVINGYSEFALMKLNKEDQLYSDITSILSSSKKAENLTRQILAFSRKQIYQPEILSINKVFSDLEQMMGRLIGEDIKINLKTRENLPNIKADPNQIEQIIINLIVNARDAINQKSDKSGEKTITIQTDIKYFDEDTTSKNIDIENGTYIIINIKDTGVGMSESVIQNIFEPFYTTKEPGKGTGLGLATVYGIIKQNDGEITVESQLNQGTTFHIYWPVTEEFVKTTDKESIKNEKLYGNETILLVEDDEELRTLADKSLTKFGYKVFSASNGLGALKLLKKDNIIFDLLITDLIMPDMNGQELSQHILKLYPGSKILFTSGYTDHYIIENLELNSDINYLQKPFTVISLLSNIRSILDNIPN